MTTKIQSAAPSTPLSDVIQAMKECPHSCLVITDNEIPVGIITERDIVRLVGDLIGNRIGLAQPVRDMMSQPIVTIGATASLLDALVIARSKKLGHLPVDNGQRKLVGLVTQSDLLTAPLPETFSDGAQALAQRLIDGIVECGIPHEQHPMKVMTLSAGISSRDQWVTDESWQDIVERADEALRQPKKQGPNRIAAAQSDRAFASDTVLFQGVISRQ